MLNQPWENSNNAQSLRGQINNDYLQVLKTEIDVLHNKIETKEKESLELALMLKNYDFLIRDLNIKLDVVMNIMSRLKACSTNEDVQNILKTFEINAEVIHYLN